MSINHNQLGRLGEVKACLFLRKMGYVIWERNFQNSRGRRKGEIDIIAYDKKEGDIVFVEVKSRIRQSSGETLPEENITYGKLLKLQKIALIYLRLKNLEEKSYRFDAVLVIFDAQGKTPEFRHIIGL